MLVEREAGRRSEMKNAGLGTGMAGEIKVLWDQVLLTGGSSANSRWVRSLVLSFHFFKKGETLRGDMITDGQVVGFGLKAQHFETNLPSFGIRKLRKFFKDFGKAHADTLAGMVPGARS